MDHREAQSLFSELMDGELDARQEAYVRDHLAHCDECAREYRALEQTMGALKDLSPVEAPEDFVEGVQREIRRRTKGRFYGRQRDETQGFRLPVEILVTLIAAVCGAIILLSDSGPGELVAEGPLMGPGGIIQIPLSEEEALRGKSLLEKEGISLHEEQVGHTRSLLGRLPRKGIEGLLGKLERALGVVLPRPAAGEGPVHLVIWLREKGEKP